MKRVIAFLTVLILITNIPMFVNAENAYKDTLRVGLCYASQSEGYFYSESNIDIVESTYLSYITTIPAGTKFLVSAYWGGVGSDYFAPVAGVLTFTSQTPIYFNDTPYRGSMEVRNHNDKLTVINVLNTEDYVASVLGKEMSAYWPLEALKAQAVCARNYALTIGGRHESYNFDICTTQHCQVYGGLKSEAETTRRAVEETKGVLVTYEGKVVPLYYFSCDGGYTENSENVWVTALGYLRGKKDIYENPEYATLYNWTKTYTKTEIEDILYKKNMNVGELLDIRIDSVTENGGVMKITFVGKDGERSFTKDAARSVLSLNSLYFDIQKNTDQAQTVAVPETLVYDVLTSDGLMQVANPKYVLTANGIEEIQYSTVEVPVESTNYVSYTFVGHGWGHRVGMSQWGAYSMAKLNLTYEDILNFYFTDIEIVKNIINEPVEIPSEEMSEEPIEQETFPEGSGYLDEAELEKYYEESDAESEDETIADENTHWSDTGI